MSQKNTIYAIIILLLTFIAYLPVFQLGFTNYDDQRYILENQRLHISIQNIFYYFSHFFDGHYHPLTMLSFMTDHWLYGINATGFHTSNLILHLLNNLLVFVFILKLTGKGQTAFFTALLFGICPLGVESVAWISERKNLLYTFFLLISLIFYLKYNRGNNKKHYILAILAFLFSSLSKAQAIILPLLLILIDYYQTGLSIKRKKCLEKLPFFVLAILFGLLAQYAQASFWESEESDYDLLTRLFFAAYAFSNYIFKLIIPHAMSALYPYPVESGKELPVQMYPYWIPVIVYIGLIIYFLKKNRLISFSLLFFAVNILFLLKITGVPYGDYLMADRYTYMASIGIFLLLAYIITRLVNILNKYNWLAYILFAAYSLFFMYSTHMQTKTWKNGTSLWKNVLQYHPQNYQAWNDLGTAYAAEGKTGEAEESFHNAIRINPDKSAAYNNYGNLKARNKQYVDAIQLFDKAIALDPDYAKAYNNRATAYKFLDQQRRAIEDYKTAIILKPQMVLPRINLAKAYQSSGLPVNALKTIEDAITINPDLALAHEIKASILMDQQEYVKALNHLNHAIDIIRDDPVLYALRGMAKLNLSKQTAGCEDLKKAYDLGLKSLKDQIEKYCQGGS
ncbi:MAG: tetratricopeptide repeat protein [Bacteroidales bacterium]|nr:tetratricopeptide repeat protein [Bacteroidales bacterium]MCF8398195.1 tetratricopeptide repeat protein [Bacteroidales bacterium]